MDVDTRMTLDEDTHCLTWKNPKETTGQIHMCRHVYLLIFKQFLLF